MIDDLVADEGPKPRKDSRLEGFRVTPPPRIPRPDPYRVTITWQTDAKAPPGMYRIVHHGRFKKDGKVTRFTARSRPFRVGP